MTPMWLVMALSLTRKILKFNQTHNVQTNLWTLEFIIDQIATLLTCHS